MLGTNNDFASLNLFTYCGNNPVARVDNGGCFWNIAAGAIIGGTISAASQILTNIIFGQDTFSNVFVAFATGAVSGGFAASGLPVVGQRIVNAVISGVGEAISQAEKYLQDKNSFQWEKAFLAVGVAAVLGSVSGHIGGEGTRVQGSAYRCALDNLDNVTNRISSGVYSNAGTASKLLASAEAKVRAIGWSATKSTAAKYAAGTTVSQYGMAITGIFLNMV